MVKIENPKTRNNIRGIDVEFFSFKNDDGDDVNLIISRSEMPFEGDEILVEQLDGSYLIQKAKKNLSNKDLYVESTRMVFKIILKNDEIPEAFIGNDSLNNKTLFIECQSSRDQKSPGFLVYDSNKIFFEIKTPVQMHVF